MIICLPRGLHCKGTIQLKINYGRTLRFYNLHALHTHSMPTLYVMRD